MVEPTCERQRAGRVETMVRVSGDWGRVCFSVSCGFDSGRSFVAARLNQLQGRDVVARLNRLGGGGSWLSRPASVSELGVSKPW